MKKTILVAMSVFAAVLSLASFVSAEPGIVERARKDLSINPLIGTPSIKNFELLWGDRKDPYILRFIVELNRPGHVWAQWSPRNGGKVISAIKTYRMDRYDYVHLVTLDMRDVVKYTGSFGTPIQLEICTESEVGYPWILKTLHIHRKPNVPKDQWPLYFEATPLEIVVKGTKPENDEYFSTKPPAK